MSPLSSFTPRLVQFVRTPRGALITAFVLLQLLLPLRYYLGRQDQNDERFAWRMFSSKRMMTCSTTFLRNDVPVPMMRTSHEAWIAIANRGRVRVLERMAATLCADAPGADVRLAQTCTDLDGTTSKRGGYNMCEIPNL